MTHSRETEYFNKKLEEAETLRIQLTKQCNDLEKHLILVNQAFDKNNLKLDYNINTNKYDKISFYLEEEKDHEEESKSRRTWYSVFFLFLIHYIYSDY